MAYDGVWFGRYLGGWIGAVETPNVNSSATSFTSTVLSGVVSKGSSAAALSVDGQTSLNSVIKNSIGNGALTASSASTSVISRYANLLATSSDTVVTRSDSLKISTANPALVESTLAVSTTAKAVSATTTAINSSEASAVSARNVAVTPQLTSTPTLAALTSKNVAAAASAGSAPSTTADALKQVVASALNSAEGVAVHVDSTSSILHISFQYMSDSTSASATTSNHRVASALLNQAVNALSTVIKHAAAHSVAEERASCESANTRQQALFSVLSNRTEVLATENTARSSQASASQLAAAHTTSLKHNQANPTISRTAIVASRTIHSSTVSASVFNALSTSATVKKSVNSSGLSISGSASSTYAYSGHVGVCKLFDCINADALTARTVFASADADAVITLFAESIHGVGVSSEIPITFSAAATSFRTYNVVSDFVDNADVFYIPTLTSQNIACARRRVRSSHRVSTTERPVYNVTVATRASRRDNNNPVRPEHVAPDLSRVCRPEPVVTTREDSCTT